MCDSGVFVGREGVERERKREREKERQREGDGEEGDGEDEEGARVLWALGGNLCLAFYGWGSYNHPFVTSGKR